jgi:hypothetical protein
MPTWSRVICCRQPRCARPSDFANVPAVERASLARPTRAVGAIELGLRRTSCPRNGGELAGCVIAPPFRRANACLDRACRDPQRKASALLTYHFSPPRSGEESPGFIPSFSPKSRTVAVLEKSLSFAPHPGRPYFLQPSFP